MLQNLDMGALTLSIVVFVVACLVAWALRYFQVTDGVGLIALLILPLATYGVATGFVKKISTPGGWAAEFREVATARIEPARLVDEVEDLAIIEKAGLAAISDHIDQIEPGKPIAIGLTLGRTGYYSPNAIATYIRAFLVYDPDLTVIFHEGNGRFVASANGISVLAAVQLDSNMDRFVQALESADLLALRRMLVLTTNSVRAETTNAEALQLMLQDGVDAMIKVGTRGHAQGVVRRDQIVSRLMIKLAEG